MKHRLGMRRPTPPPAATIPQKFVGWSFGSGAKAHDVTVKLRQQLQWTDDLERNAVLEYTPLELRSLLAKYGVDVPNAVFVAWASELPRHFRLIRSKNRRLYVYEDGKQAWRVYGVQGQIKLGKVK
jgi:hypothetical protein